LATKTAYRGEVENV